MNNPQMRMSSSRIAFTLFSAFALCANLSTALHESGHALGCWLGGGRVTEVVLRPFDFSHVSMDMGNVPPWSHMLTSGGGILFGIMFALPLLPLSRRFPRGSIGWLILFTTVTLAFGLNGVLLLQSVATGRGDPEAVLIYADFGYGIPRVVTRIVFVLLAIPILAVFGKLTFQLFRAFGPAPADSHAGWVTTVAASFLPYFGLMTIHTAVFGDRELLFRQMLPFYVPFILLFELLILAAASWVYQTAGPTREAPPAANYLNGAKAVKLFLLAAAVIAGELLFLGPRQ